VRSKYATHFAWIDTLMNILLAFMGLYAVAFIMTAVNKKQQEMQASAPMKGVFLITATWEPDHDDDVDLWVEDPEGHTVGYNRREDGLMHLDRDDLGFSSDTVETQFGPVTVKDNRELVTIRGITPGEFTVNVHMYRKTDPKPTHVRVTLEKLQPYSIVTAKEVILTVAGDEVTSFRFTLNSKGEVTEINQLQKKFASNAARGQPPGQP
jgi:hypothetical protein